MAQISVPSAPRQVLLDLAHARLDAVQATNPALGPAVDLQRKVLGIVVDLSVRVALAPLPRLSLPPKYVAAKLGRGVPALAGEPVPIPLGLLAPAMIALSRALVTTGADDPAEDIAVAIETARLDAAALLTSSLGRDQHAIRSAAAERGLTGELVWLVAELAVSPYATALANAILGATASPPVAAALAEWDRGYCPSCGSWPAAAEVLGGRRVLRCSLCASGWEPHRYACIYCGETGDAFVTAAPEEARKDRRVELCRACGGYLKTIDVAELSPFPLLTIGDLETMDLDMTVMQLGYGRPPLKDFRTRR